MLEQTDGQPSAWESRFTSLEADFSKLSSKLEAMESKLHTSENGGSPLDVLKGLSERLSVLEERMRTAGAPIPATDNSSTAQLSESLQLLEQKVSNLQNQMQTPGQGQSQSSNEGTPRASRASTDSEIMVDEDAARRASTNELEYEWRPTIWDLSLFLGTRIMSPGSSVVVAVCVLVNLFMLIAFLEQIFFFGIPDFNDESEAEFELWRKTVAHAAEYRNRITGESLANGVCEEKLYFPVANYQLRTVIQLRSYLKPMDFMGIETGLKKGFIMCALSLLVWYFTVTLELREVIDLLLAFKNVPIEGTTRFVQDTDEKQKVHLASVSSFRWCWVLLIQMARLGVAGTLAVQGTFFLLAEVDVETMILNSAALGIILSFDELLFAAVIPSIPQKAITQIMPMPRGEQHNMGKLFNRWGWALLITVALGTIFGLLMAFALQPFQDTLQDNLEALCGGVEGTYNFVVGVDSIGIPWAAATPDANELEDMYANKAIEDALKNGFPTQKLQPTERANMGPFMQLLSGSILETAIKTEKNIFGNPQDWTIVDPKDMDQVVGWPEEWKVLGKSDLADEPGTVYNRYLKHLLKTTGDVNCSDVPERMCNTQGSKREDVVMRVLCGERCGCATPLDGTVSNPYSDTAQFGYLGCAKWNMHKASFVETMEELPCEDTKSRDVFLKWVEAVGQGLNYTGGKLWYQLVSAWDDKEEGGCDGVAAANLGGEDSSRACASTSLPTICPQACGCDKSQTWTPRHAGEMYYCPYACNRTKPPCITNYVPITTMAPGTRGPMVGFPCQFPYLYKGRKYNKCTWLDWTGPWCPVALLDGVSYRWGDCPNNTEVCVCPNGVNRCDRNGEPLPSD